MYGPYPVERKVVVGLGGTQASTAKEYHTPQGELVLAAGVPFRRARMLFNQYKRASLIVNPVERMAALAAIPSYFSRGKGRDKPFIARIESRQKDRSKYFPHQGEREILRRAFA